MYEDDDFLPMRCPRCRHDFEEQIGGLRDKLRNGKRIRCLECEATLYGSYEELERFLREKRADSGKRV